MATLDFGNPTDILQQQDNFGERDVGLNSPDGSSFVRLSTNGDVEVFASEGLGFVIHKASKSISFIADNIKFYTKENEGLRWNKLAFNHKALYYQEPTFVQLKDEDMPNMFAGTDQYFYQGQ